MLKNKFAGRMKTLVEASQKDPSEILDSLMSEKVF
jgi:hypothetical protein